MTALTERFVDPYPHHRETARRLGESNDCTVVSFATVWNTSYEKAHTHLKVKCKRPYANGPTPTRFSYADTWCPKTRMEYQKGAEGKRLIEWMQSHPEGRFWIAVKGHALAIIDGVLYDHTRDFNRKIMHCWKVWPGEAPKKTETIKQTVGSTVRKAPEWY